MAKSCTLISMKYGIQCSLLRVFVAGIGTVNVIRDEGLCMFLKCQQIFQKNVEELVTKLELC